MPLQLQIVTPDGSVFSDVVDYVLLPGTEGELGVLPQHAALVTTLKPGELQYTKESKRHEYCIGEGLVEITGSSVRVLTDIAVEEAGIDEAHVQEALARAEARMKELDLGHEEVAAVQAIIVRSTAQLHFKRKRRGI